MTSWKIFKASWWKAQLGGGRMVALVILGLLLVLRASDPTLLEVVRSKTFDGYQRIKPRATPEVAPVTIVDLDDASLAEVGQWPWPRTVLAKLVDNLTAAGAVAIGFDVVFAENDRLSPGKVAQSTPGLDAESIKRMSALPSNDQVFAESMKRSRVVVGMSGQVGAGTHQRGVLPPDVPSWGVGGDDPVPWLETVDGSSFDVALRNVPELDNAASGWGVFTVTPETDGVVRRVPALFTDGKDLYPALSTELLRLGTASESFGVFTTNSLGGIQYIKLGRNKVQTDGNGRIWLYARRHDQSLYLPAKDILNGTFDPARVAGRLIIVGTSAVGLGDIRAIATERHIPGVEVHSQIIESILSAQQLEYPATAPAIEFLAALVGGLLMIILVPLIGARWTMMLFLGVAGLVGAGSWYEFAQKLTLYDPVFPIISALGCYIITTYGSFAREEAQKRYVRGAMGRYMSPALVEKVAENPGLLKLGGENKDMTLLFCDIRGFTTISETFGADAQGLTKLINRFLTPMTDVILERKGTIDKYMGDCIMAFWNAPLDDPDHAANACRSALKMIEDLQPLNDKLAEIAKQEERRHVPINIGIGLNSGDVVVGNMGSDQRFDYSVLGDNVNLASRLEGQSKPYGVHIVIGENTFLRAPDFACLELDLIKVKGKTEAVRIYTLVGDEATAKTPEFLALKVEHDKLLAAYRKQEWAEARAQIVRCNEIDPGFHLEKLYHIYEERMQEYEANPPGADWDGVYVATSK